MSRQLAEAHAAVRAAHGPGRAEFLFDPRRALACDAQEGIGSLVLAPSAVASVAAWFRVSADVLEGHLIEREAKRYRIVVDPRVEGCKVQDGSPAIGFVLEAPPPFGALAPVPLYLKAPPT